jgi:hypothetical protein
MAEAEGELSVSGIVPRACSDVLRALEVRRAHGVSTLLRVSYVEIYGEQVTDLLNENVTVGQWQGVAHRAGKSLPWLGMGWGEVKEVGRRSCRWRLTQLPSSLPPPFPPSLLAQQYLQATAQWRWRGRRTCASCCSRAKTRSGGRRQR